MKSIQKMNRIVLFCAALTTGAFCPQLSHATPYASGVTNASGTIKFFLNETATTVKVAFDNNTVTNDLTPLGQTNIGVNSFSLGAHTNYSIIVSKIGTGVPSQISPTPTAGQASTNLAFFGPRGVAVNKNPKGPNFGRIYVANASGGTFAGRTVGRGIYAVNPDYSDPLGQAGGTSLPLAANFPGGTNQLWGGSTTYGPYRLWVGVDDTVYIGDCSGSGNIAGAPVWMVDPNLKTPIAVFAYSGLTGGNSGNAGPCQSQPFMTGSLATGDLTLTCLMWNFYATNTPGASYQEVLRYNIGSGPIDSTHVWTGNPIVVHTNTQPQGFGAAPGINGVVSDIFVASNGYVYVSYPRSGTGGIAAGANALWVYDNQVPANLLWASSDPATGGVTNTLSSNPTNDCFITKSIAINGISISPDNKYMVFGNSLAANYVIVNLTNGIPDKSSIKTYAAPNAINRSVAFDAADNVYTVEGNSDSLRVYSLGLTTTSTTYNDITGTNGTFNMVIPGTSISVAANTNAIWQNGSPGVFQLTRSGQNLNLPLTINFNLGGSSTNYPGEYTVTPAGIIPSTNNVVTFAANATTTNITVIPVADNVARPTTAIALSVLGGAGYAVGSPASGTITLVNTATPVISVTNLDLQMYEETNDYARFKVSRLGDTNVDLTGAINISFGGTAQLGRDFFPSNTVVDLPPGVSSTNVFVAPIHNGLVTGPLTVTATAAAGTGYTPGTSIGTVTIIDSDLAPETVLWSDNLSTDTSANWKQFFATTNNAPYDATVTWAFDYSQFGIPLAPHSTGSSPTGLYMTVNKNDTTPVAAALNFYPIGQSFSGNYAFRFDMFLIINDTTSTTEYALFGVNHSSNLTNWFRNSTGGVPVGTTFDGIFYDVESDGAALGDYANFTSPTTVNNNPTSLSATNASFFTGVFKTPPWAVGGAPGNTYFGSTPMWASVEVAQVGNVLTFKINQSVIFVTTNATAYTSGDVMLGYEDAYDSIGSNGGSVIYANARVVRLASATKPVITGITVSGGNTVVTFTADSSDTAGLFTLQSSATVNGTYTNSAAVITSPSSGIFQATIAISGPAQFYRVKRN